MSSEQGKRAIRVRRVILNLKKSRIFEYVFGIVGSILRTRKQCQRED